MNWDAGLVGSALSIAASDERRLRIMAGPGTGKSFALKRRVARLLECGQDPARILAVTFTRNAAASLVQDLTELDITGCDRVRAGTLHSYCFSLLNSEKSLERLKRRPRSIVTFSKSGSLQFEGGIMISDLVHIGEFGGKRDCTKRLLEFETAWAKLQSELPGRPKNPTDKLFEKHLHAWLCFHQSMLIDEIIPETLHLLCNNFMPDVFVAFDHVMVDEYQDLNRADQEIIDLLSKRGALTIIGDVDQSIYSFRHANPDGIVDFQSRHPTTHDELLTECRRCPKRVVKMANCLIGNNYPSNFPPRLHAMPTSDSGKVHIIKWNSPKKEAEELAKYICHLLNNPDYAPRDILIITPRRPLAYRIRDFIKQNGIPIHSFYQEEALEEDSARRAFALLTLLYDKGDRVALRWWLGKGNQSGHSGPYQKLRQHCEDTGDSPWAALKNIDQGKLNLPDTKPLLKPFRELVENITRLSELELCDLIDDLLPKSDSACSALREIADSALEDSKNIFQLFDHIKASITHPEVPDGDFVRIMSPHKAKGLTSKVVIVTACVNELFPTIRRDLTPQELSDNIREQRRLFYVTVTRCTDVLVLSSFIRIGGRDVWKCGIPMRLDGSFYRSMVASPFIKELGPSAPTVRSGEDWKASGYEEVAIP